MFAAQPYGMTLNRSGVDELLPHEGITDLCIIFKYVVLLKAEVLRRVTAFSFLVKRFNSQLEVAKENAQGLILLDKYGTERFRTYFACPIHTVMNY